MTNDADPRRSHSNPLLSDLTSDWRDRAFMVAGPDDGRQNPPSGSIGWRWLVTDKPCQTSTDWDQPDLPHVPKAPGWVQALTIIGLPLVLWAMLLLAPLILLFILTVSGFLFYWSSRRRENSRSQPKSECCAVAATELEEKNLDQSSHHGIDADDARPPLWLPVSLLLAVLFWVLVGGLTLRYLLGGAGS